MADAAAKQGTDMRVPKAQWHPEWWRLYYRGAEITHNIMHIIHLKQPPMLQWHRNVHTRLSFGNLGTRGQVLRLQWLWGRTGWRNTSGFWTYTTTSNCQACHNRHCTDLFSCLAHCPAWHHLRVTLFSWWVPHDQQVAAWYQLACAECQRNFCRSLIPTALVRHLAQHLTPQQITALVRSRDNKWAQGTKNIRQQYLSLIHI